MLERRDMGKQGPCYHCGVTSTPLWRNGPPEKPVLCNACGSRWRTKGTLANYTPLHARAESDDYEDHRVARVKSISLNKNKDVKALKRKSSHDYMAAGGFVPDYNQGFRKVVEEDTSNRSSSGSAISNSESCVQFGSADASDLTGPAQSNVWDSLVPSKKRTCVNRPKPSPVEKLTKDLYTILHEQQSSYFSGSSEEDLLFESETPMVSVEIGHGSVLIRHPSSIARDEESEASSLSVENKQYSANEAYSRSLTLPVHNYNMGNNFSSSSMDKAKNPIGEGVQQDQLKRDKFQHEKLQVLGNYNSPLCDINLNDILNFEEFREHLTSEEQKELLKYLAPLDTDKFPDNLKSMFDSLQFKENLTSFQQLLAEGVFDLSFQGASTENCKTLKRLSLSNLTTSKWVEHYNLLKKCKSNAGASIVASGPNAVASNNVSNFKRSRDSQNQKFPEAKSMMKSPKRVIMKSTYESKELVDSDGSCFSPRRLFALPTDSSSLMLESLNFVDESSDQDLLLDVPSNSSFPQAELLHPALSFGQQASTSSSSVYPNPARP
ncbi:GATA transcription factor 26-like isoform X1 [Mangifera indica]|uniref:GATA transcription factor 26-like isoform X1 n=2 Tax=Mangifera indica TaxID=29780 RepID=UPI001CF9740E|nr:GATA transcription factor 26-like isoform X1 [Mangifera indica]